MSLMDRLRKPPRDPFAGSAPGFEDEQLDVLAASENPYLQLKAGRAARRRALKSRRRAEAIRSAPDLFREGERAADIKRRRRRGGQATTMLTSQPREGASNLLGL